MSQGIGGNIAAMKKKLEGSTQVTVLQVITD